MNKQYFLNFCADACKYQTETQDPEFRTTLEEAINRLLAHHAFADFFQKREEDRKMREFISDVWGAPE